MTNVLLSELLAILAKIPPSNQAAGALTSAAFKLNLCRKAEVIVQVGTPGAGGTVDAKVQWSATAGGTYADVPGAAIVQMNAAGISKIDLRADRVNALGCGPFFKVVTTVAVATTPTAVIVLGGDARYLPASDYDDASVVSPSVAV